MYNLGLILMLCCAEQKTPLYDLVTIVQKRGEQQLVVKYVDMDRNGTVDFYGYGFGEESGNANNPFSISHGEHFFVSERYAQEHDLKINRNSVLKVMDRDIEMKVNREYAQERARGNSLALE